MLRSEAGRSNPDIERAIKDLLAEDANFDRNENRSAHREHLVRHLRVEIRELEQVIDAVSRNISVAGIGIITDQDIASGTIAVLGIERLKGPTTKIIAECRWSRNYGENWFISGWKFQNLKR